MIEEAPTSPTFLERRSSNPDSHVQTFGSFREDDDEKNKRAVRPLEAAPKEVLAFSEISKPETIRGICLSRVPGWSVMKAEDLHIDQICEGLSNQLFKVYIQNAQGKGLIVCVLFRIYGKEVRTLYDEDLEFTIFKLLASYQIAPNMYAHGDGWRIEEWHAATTLKTKHMCNPSILAQVAAQLARLHKLGSRPDFPREILSLPPVSGERLKAWSSGAVAAAAKLKMNNEESARRLAQLNIEEIVEEAAWLKDYVVADDPHISGSGLDIVFCHWDDQENNILQTHYGLRFIDFEYSNMDYQAYDIANYFVECTIDYNYDKYPFYKMILSDFPTEWSQRLFCCIYLSEYLEMEVKLDDAAVTRLLTYVHRFTLMSHYLWTAWSVIRAPQASTFNEFDFLHYAQARWDNYKRKKDELLRSPGPLPVGELLRQGAPERPSDRESGGAKRAAALGGALTAFGVVLGVGAVVVVSRLARR